VETYINFANAYDEFMDNVPYHQWGNFIREILLKHNIKEGLVADLGCGTGTLTEILASFGYDMIGIDYSAQMLAVAKNKEESSPYDILYLLQDMREFELYGSVKAVVSVCDSINYILETSELEKVFERVNYYLDPNGLLIFDFNTEYKYREVIGNQTIGENREDKSFIWENYYYEEERINEIELSLFVKEEDGYNSTGSRGELYRKHVEMHQQRAYSLEEIQELLEKVGLEFVKAYDDYTADEVHDKSERVVVVGRKSM